MRIKLEPLMAIVNYWNNYSPLFITPSTLEKNTLWISEYTNANQLTGDFLLYNLDTQEIVTISPQLKMFMEQVADKAHQIYLYFEQDMEEFMKKYPHESWFLPEILQGEVV